MYIITWSYGYGCTVSGILPETFKSKIDAQFECDCQNRWYNGVNHIVEGVLEQ